MWLGSDTFSGFSCWLRPRSPGYPWKDPKHLLWPPCLGTIEAATHSRGGRGLARALLAPVNRLEQLIDFFEPLEWISQKFPPQNPTQSPVLSLLGALRDSLVYTCLWRGPHHGFNDLHPSKEKFRVHSFVQAPATEESRVLAGQSSLSHPPENFPCDPAHVKTASWPLWPLSLE